MAPQYMYLAHFGSLVYAWESQWSYSASYVVSRLNMWLIITMWPTMAWPRCISTIAVVRSLGIKTNKGVIIVKGFKGATL